VLTVNDLTVINTQPADATICEGFSKVFTISVSGDNLAYQWQKDAANISNNTTYAGATTNALTISNASSTNSGVYVCQITGACGDKNTNPATLTVNPTTVITQNPSNKTLCAGDALSLSVIAQGTSLSYQRYQVRQPLEQIVQITVKLM
jgi:hypothetical protein